MQQAMRFRVIIGNEIKKITFQNGIPSSVEDFIKVFQQAFSITTDIGLHHKDADFDDFFTLTSTSDLKDKDTLKVVQMPPGGVIANKVPQERNLDFTLTSTSDLKAKDTLKVVQMPLGLIVNKTPQEGNLDISDVPTVGEPLPVDSQANLISSPPVTENLWPAAFPVPTKVALRQGNERFLKDGLPLTSQGVKSFMLERLAEGIFSYTVYPNDPQRATAAQALERHPCVREAGSSNTWQQSPNYKCANYQMKLKAHGNPELLINTLKRKQEGDGQPAQNIKKPMNVEVNDLPPYPAGETADSLETVRLELIAATKTKNNSQMINNMMSRTYSCRRREVVGQSIKMAKFKERWPALFDPVQINEEFRRCTTMPLESSFISQLDRYTPKFLELFSSKGGAVGERMKSVLIDLIKDPRASAGKKRDVTLRCLIEYLGESVQDLVSDYYRTAEKKVLEDLKTQSLRIYVCNQPDAVGIIIDGIPVLTGLDNMSRACCLLLGLTYALNLDFPPKLAKTFEVFQRLFVGLNMLQPKPTSKYIRLKKKLLP